MGSGVVVLPRRPLAEQPPAIGTACHDPCAPPTHPKQPNRPLPPAPHPPTPPNLPPPSSHPHPHPNQPTAPFIPPPTPHINSKREYKIKNLRTECDRISAKEKSEGGLTAGQASTLVRNERAIAALQEEVEEIEDSLNDSVRDSIKGKAAAAKVGVWEGGGRGGRLLGGGGGGGGGWARERTGTEARWYRLQV
jgi:hypothetical protein